MPRVAKVDGSPHDAEALAAIAQSARGAFSTVEDMTQSFIREAIIQGLFRPGERLNLDTIASALGVSRMPVRASLRQLEGEGLLRIHPYRGATVSVLQPHEIAEIYELRVLLECHLLEHAVARLDAGLLVRLEAVVARMEASRELGERLEARREFYELLYQRAERPRALAQVNNLRSSVGRYLLLQRVDEPHGHEDFLAFLRARDTEHAQEWLAAHLNRVSRKLQSLLAADAVPPEHPQPEAGAPRR